ncbi:secreted RxLR effector protein 161-like [Carya illinoinensis]|uniref:secreted RxLR effector protein 161-like n=1 Tax=Carya illinoinensis TaxID=32201 RepID=UPI001C726172|nr:secreted RxLR effector protein 161-like [Carya illinoinensis]
MSGANPISSPMSASTKLSKFDSPSFENVTLYRSIIGNLQYLSLTRPDISFSVNKACQFMHEPKLSHWLAVKRILRYLKSTINYGLFFSKQSSFNLHAYSDADWVGCPDDRKSTRGYCILLGNHPISWSRVAVKALQVKFCSSKDQLADVFTKPLVSDRFSLLRSSLRVLDTPFDSWGRISLSQDNATQQNKK